MAEIVNLHDPKEGELSFIACHCTPDGTPYMVVVIVSESPIVCGLVCPECDARLDVINGIVQK